MKNILSYLSEIKDTPFAEEEFNELDSLVLCQLSYLRFDGADWDSVITMPELIVLCEDETLYSGVLQHRSFSRLAKSVAGSVRFSSLRLANFVTETDQTTEKQFFAVTCFLGDDTAFIAYRGTDSTIVGWKEDFNMAFISPIPSQEEALVYLNTVGSKAPAKLRIGGHSKGGNLAVYAATFCLPEIQNRILAVYSHDGPGFRNDIFTTPEYLAIQGRIHKYVPQSSIIGMILQHQETGVVVESNTLGIMQHDPFSWEIENNTFSTVASIRNNALMMDESLNDWLSKMTDSQRELFVNTLFDILSSSSAETIYELVSSPKNLFTTLNAVKDIDKETKEFVRSTIKSLITTFLKYHHQTSKTEGENNECSNE